MVATDLTHSSPGSARGGPLRATRRRSLLGIAVVAALAAATMPPALSYGLPDENAASEGHYLDAPADYLPPEGGAVDYPPTATGPTEEDHTPAAEPEAAAPATEQPLAEQPLLAPPVPLDDDFDLISSIYAYWDMPAELPIPAGTPVTGWFGVDLNDANGAAGFYDITIRVEIVGGRLVTIPEGCAAGSALSADATVVYCRRPNTALGSVFRTDFVALPFGGDVPTTMTGRASVLIDDAEVAVAYLETIPVAPAPIGLEVMVSSNMPGGGHGFGPSYRRVGIALALPRGYQLISDTVTFTLEFFAHDAGGNRLDIFDLLATPGFQLDDTPAPHQQGNHIPAWTHVAAQPTSRPNVALTPLPGTNTVQITLTGLDLGVDLPPFDHSGAQLRPDWQYFAVTYLRLNFLPMVDQDLPVTLSAELRNGAGTTLGGQPVVDGTDTHNPNWPGIEDDNRTVAPPFNPMGGVAWEHTWWRGTPPSAQWSLMNTLGIENALRMESGGWHNAGLGRIAPGQHVFSRISSQVLLSAAEIADGGLVGHCVATQFETAPVLGIAVQEVVGGAGRPLNPNNLTLWFTTGPVLDSSTERATEGTLDCSMDGPGTWQQYPATWVGHGATTLHTLTDFPANITAWKVLYAPSAGSAYFGDHVIVSAHEVQEAPSLTQVWTVGSRRVGPDAWVTQVPAVALTPEPGALFTATTRSVDRFTILPWSPRVTVDTSAVSPEFGSQVTLPVVHGPRGIRNAASQPVDYVLQVELPPGVLFTGVAEGTPLPRSVVVCPDTSVTTIEWDVSQHVNEDSTYLVLTQAVWPAGTRRVEARITSDDPAQAAEFTEIPAASDYTTMVRTPEGETRLAIGTISPLPLNEYHCWTVTLANLDTRARDLTDTILVLPWNGDGRGTDLSGGLSLGEVLPGPDQEVWFTTAPSVDLRTDPLFAANGGVGNPGSTTIWTQVRPADPTTITGIRLVSTAPLRGGEVFSTSVCTANDGGLGGDRTSMSAEARETLLPGTRMYARTFRHYLGSPDLTVVKTSPAGDPAVIVVPGGDANGVPVVFTATNTGTEALIGLDWDDQTLAGPDVSWTHCTPGLPDAADDGENPLDGLSVDQVFAGLRLEPGESITCHGTLDMGEDSFHENVVVVDGRGYQSGEEVEDSDDWELTVLDSHCEKEYTYRVLDPGQATTHTWTVPNSSELGMPINAVTDLSAALAFASLIDGSVSAVLIDQATGAEVATSNATVVGDELHWSGAIPAGHSVVVTYQLRADDQIAVAGQASVVTATCVGYCEVPLLVNATAEPPPPPPTPTPTPTTTPDPTPTATPESPPTANPSSAPSTPAAERADRPPLPVTGAAIGIALLLAVGLTGVGAAIRRSAGRRGGAHR
ncbi:MAG: hypothetical protein FWG11_01020 [Promicromonosporaceae bacterium]|nr:hypothetical protein [Promicromonosporaceae bacterium]